MSPSRFQTLQNQHLFGHPRLVITYPCFMYIPGIKSSPRCPVAGPPIFTGAICFHSFSSCSASGKSQLNVTEICTSSASANNEGLPTNERSSVGVAFVLRGNTRIIFTVLLLNVTVIVWFPAYGRVLVCCLLRDSFFFPVENPPCSH